MAKAGIWVEKFRPRTLSDVVFQDDRQQKAFSAFVEAKDIPHLLLHGVQGTGKTTVSKALLRDLGVDTSDILRVNCSDEKIDALRNKVSSFAMTLPIGKFKVVQLEECLHKDTLVWVLRDGMEQQIPISLLDPNNDLVKSFNKKKNTSVWLPFDKKNMGTRQLVRIKLSNGDTVLCTSNHKWVSAVGQTVKTDSLSAGDSIFSPPINRLSNIGQPVHEKEKT